MADITIYVDGTDNAGTHHFLSLNAAIEHMKANHADFTLDNGSGGAGVVNVEISITTADSTAVNVVSLVTSASYYLNVYTTAAARHAGAWSTSKYRLTAAADAGVGVLGSNISYARYDGLQIQATSSTEANSSTFYAINGNVRLSNCIVRSAGNATYAELGVRNAGTLTMWNCIVYGQSANAFSASYYDGGTSSVWNCTMVSGAYGLFTNGGTCTAKNVYATSYYAFSGTITQTNCAAADTSADGTDPHDSIATNTTQFVNVTAGSEDFHLAGTGSGLYGHGADNTGDSAPLNFTTDIDGNTITGRFDIGADWYSASGVGATRQAFWFYRQLGS